MILSIAKKEMHLMLKDKGMFFYLIGMPLMFIVLFASVLGATSDTKVTVHYADLDQSEASQKLVQSIGDIPGFVMKNESGPVEEQVEQIRSGKLSTFVVIEKGFGSQLQSGEQASITFYRDASADSASAPIQAVLQNFSTQYREGKLSGTLAAMGKSEAEVNQILLQPLVVKESKENAATYNIITQIVPGYTVMFVFFILISMVRRFVQERESGMAARLQSTRMKPWAYLIGMWIPNVVIVLVQCAVLLAFGHFVYNLHLGDLTAIVLIVFSLALCGTGIGLALALMVKSENQGMAFTQLLTMGGAVIGGLWFPTEFLPKLVQTIAHFVPQYWAQKGMQDVMLRGVPISSILPSLAVLLGFAALGLTVAALSFKRYLRTAVS